MIDYVIDEKGEEVISERHQADYKPPHVEESTTEDVSKLGQNGETDTSTFTDIEFDDI